jgi:chromosome segregation protein
MIIEKIELIGFKSFGDKTVFSLHSGITTIVGPNGCGKSNVVDAFKWVLGEQSVKSLRGGKMEEVIFAGSQAKKPRGMAEVSLYVRGINPSGNGKENLTVVSRRLYRSGESEYMLDRKVCRLKDIRNIFLDTGLEVKSYSMLEQDRVSSIVTSKADDRRFLIEEVAGVVKYKLRRNEAMSKLESSRNNMARITDIISEVRRQLNSLDRQAKKAERYKKLMAELKGIEIRIAKRDYSVLGMELEQIIKELSAARQEDASSRAEMSRIEAGIESQRITLAEKEKGLESEQNKLLVSEREMSEIQRAVAVSKTEREHLGKSIERLIAQGMENNEKRSTARGRAEELAAAVRELEEKLETQEARAEEQSAGLKEAERAIKDREHNLDNRRRDSFRFTEEIGNSRNERQKHATTLESLEKRSGDLEKEARDLSGALEETDRKSGEIQASLKSRNSELLVYRQERETLSGEIESLRDRINQLSASTAMAREEMASATSRMESLREMDVSEAAEEDLKGSINIAAAVAGVIEAQSDYERAIEAALREATGGFIVPAFEDIFSALGVLEERGTERIAFIPMESAGHQAAEKPEGALAMAHEVVRTKEGFEEVARRLLGNVVVVRDIRQAVALRHSGLMAVTLQGEVLTQTGAVIAGKGRGLLALKRQIRELGTETEKKKARLESLAREAEASSSSLNEKRSALEDLSGRTVEAEKTLSLLKQQAEQNATEAGRLNRKQAHLKIEQDEAQKEKSELLGFIEAGQEDIGRLESQKSSVEGTIERLLMELNGLRSDFEKKRSESVDLKLRINSSRERMNSLANERQATERLSLELADKETLLEREIANTKERIAGFLEQEKVKEEALGELAIRAQAVKTSISSMRDGMAGLSEEIRETERELRNLRFRIDSSAQAISEHDVSRAEHALRIDNLTSNIRNSYGVDLKTVEAAEVTDEDGRAMDELKEKLEKMGPVSLGSIEEYEELKARYDFLSQQKEDLEKSIAELEEAISRINATTRKKLREAYDALKVKFSEVFVALFGGGKAELELTNPNNILETGIDIIAQPPGKRLQNISLLSGGEKTLTALALLFSGFLIKPTPLCILDEADAALDESNTTKFAELLKELSDEIQFIVVTHNKVTMESSDHIYGVTMEEPGNSKVISMELKEA